MYFLSRNTFHKHNYLLYKSKFTFYVFLLYRDWLTTTRQDHQWWLLFTVSWSLCLPPTVPTTWRNSSVQKWVLHQRCRCSGVIWPHCPLLIATMEVMIFDYKCPLSNVPLFQSFKYEPQARNNLHDLGGVDKVAIALSGWNPPNQLLTRNPHCHLIC